MGNSWIEHVKAFANKKGIKYNEAMKDPECKASYKKTGSGVKKATVVTPKGTKMGYAELKKRMTKFKKGKGLIDEMGQQQAIIANKSNELGLGANAGSAGSK